MNLMIFAAGFGTRMRPLTDNRPKALVEVAGRPLIDWALDEAQAADPKVIVVNGHYRAEQLHRHLAKSGVHFINEEPEVLETGGGLRNALPALGKAPVMTLNSDAIWRGPRAANVLREAWNPDQMDALLLMIPQSRALGGAGGWKFQIGADGIVSKVENGLTYTGAAIVKTTGLAEINQSAFSLRDLWEPMLHANRLGGVIYPGHWADVGSPEGIARAEALLAAPKESLDV